MSKALSANIHDPNHTADEYDIYFNGNILLGNGDREFSANVHDPNHTADEYDIYFNGELIDSGGGDDPDINSWSDGVPYNLKWVDGYYCKASDGEFIAYEGWSRTGYINCEGASTLDFASLPAAGFGQSNCFYDANKTRINSFRPSNTPTTVPSNAVYFVLSAENDKVPIIGCTPND